MDDFPDDLLELVLAKAGLGLSARLVSSRFYRLVGSRQTILTVTRAAVPRGFPAVAALIAKLQTRPDVSDLHMFLARAVRGLPQLARICVMAPEMFRVDLSQAFHGTLMVTDSKFYARYCRHKLTHLRAPDAALMCHGIQRLHLEGRLLPTHIPDTVTSLTLIHDRRYLAPKFRVSGARLLHLILFEVDVDGGLVSLLHTAPNLQELSYARSGGEPYKYLTRVAAHICPGLHRIELTDTCFGVHDPAFIRLWVACCRLPGVSNPWNLPGWRAKLLNAREDALGIAVTRC